MLAGVLPRYRPCLLVWCLIINHACWCVYYRSCLIVCCHITNHTFWWGASLSVMPVGVVLHYRPCLLVNCHCNPYFTSCVYIEEGWLQGWYYLYRGAIIDMSADPVPLSDMPACTVQLYQTCMLGTFFQIRVFVKCCFIRQGIWSVTNPSDMPTCRVPLPRDCNTHHLGYIKFWMMHE